MASPATRRRHYGNQGGFPAAAVRCGDWKLIERLLAGCVHLFDLVHDVGEQHDLAAEQPERVEQLRALLHDWYRGRAGGRHSAS